MKAALVALLCLVTLAGCVDPDDDEEGRDFERTCPVYTQSPGNPKWTVSPWVQNSTSQNPDVAERNQRDKWIVTPTLLKEDPYTWNNSTLDFIEIEIDLEALADGKLIFKAFESEEGEPAVYNKTRMTEEQFYAYTGDQMVFRDMQSNQVRYLGEVTFGPTYGNEEEDILRDAGGRYRLEFTQGSGGFDPHNLRIDAFLQGDQDGDDDTVTVASFTITATLWYRHHDCA